MVDLDDLEKGTEFDGWVSTISDTVSSWGTWFSGADPPAPAPVPPEVELQTFSNQKLPQEDEPLLGGGDESSAPWGDDSDLPGELEAEDYEGSLPSSGRRRTLINSGIRKCS